MSFGRRQIERIDASGLVAALVGTVHPITLPSGPGYYRVLRVSVTRTVGAAAATIQPALNDAATADPTDVSAPAPGDLAWQAAAAAAPPCRWPLVADDQADPGRYLLSRSGAAKLMITPNVAGDTFDVVILIERIR